MRALALILALIIPNISFAMCECKAKCHKDFQFKEFSTREEAITEAKKHKAISIQKYGDKYQLLIWDESISCESTWPETCVCDNEKYGGGNG